MARLLTRSAEKKATADGRRMMRELQKFIAAKRRIPLNFLERFEEFFIDTALLGMSAGVINIQEGIKFAFERDIVRGLPAHQISRLSEALRPGIEANIRPFAQEILFTLQQALSEIEVQELTYTQALAHARNELAAIGASTSSFHRMETEIVTTVYDTYNVAQYHLAFHTDLFKALWGFRYHTQGDDKVRPNHEAQNGVTLSKFNPWWHSWWPPNGYNCRCYIEFLYEPQKVVHPTRQFNPDEGFNTVGPLTRLQPQNLEFGEKFNVRQCTCSVCV